MDATTPTKQADEKFCSDCGSIIKIKAEICPKCGVRQRAAFEGVIGAAGRRNKTLAALLALFLGGIGIHKFYLGKTAWGIVYLVFCLTFIPAVVSFVEGILLLCMSEERFDSKFNSA